MIERDDKGRFIKGNKSSPGRPKREVEREYLDAMMGVVSIADWRAITKKAVQQALRGDSVARKWLSDYLMGTPVQRNEHTGEDGQPLSVQIIEVVKDYGRDEE